MSKKSLGEGLCGLFLLNVNVSAFIFVFLIFLCNLSSVFRVLQLIRFFSFFLFSELSPPVHPQRPDITTRPMNFKAACSSLVGRWWSWAWCKCLPMVAVLVDDHRLHHCHDFVQVATLVTSTPTPTWLTRTTCTNTGSLPANGLNGSSKAGICFIECSYCLWRNFWPHQLTFLS